MTALLLVACVGMITGAFFIFRISPMDFTLGVFRRLTTGPKSIRDDINETTQRKKPGFFRREILPNGDRRYNTLFRYVITENHMENDKFIIEGHHAQVNEISVSLRKRLLENGMPNEELQALLKPEKEVNAT